MHAVKAILVAVVLVLAPIPVGGYEAWLLPVITMLTGAALLIELTREPAHDAADGSAWLVFWSVAAGYALVQVAAWLVVRDVSFYIPGATLGLEYGVIDVGSVVVFMARLAVYGALAFTVTRMKRRELVVVLLAVVVSALFQSLYGLANLAAGNTMILGTWDGGMHRDSVMGTFYSRNQLAGYLALALPVGLAWLWRLQSAAKPRSGARSFFLGLAVLYAMLLAVALAGSGSRFGVTATLFGLLAWAWLASRARQRDPATATRRLSPWLAVALALLAVLWFGPDVIIERFLQLSASDARFTLWATMLDMPFKVWLWGIGPGQFIDVFKLFQGPDLPQTYWRALNDPLQFVLEYGLVGTAVMLLASYWWLKRVWPSRLGTLHRAALAGVAAMAVHSLGDFDLRVPGTAVLFWAMVGLALRPAVRRGVGREDRTVSPALTAGAD